MRVRTLLVAGWIAVASAGCQGVGLFDISFRNLYECPRRAADTCTLEDRCRKWAETNWKEFAADCVDKDFSPPFKEGFSDGFTDYLVFGGKGKPPAIPPFHYQLFGVYTVPGERSDEAREWFEGFRTGAARARMTGLREQIVIPLSAQPINAVEAPRHPGGQPAGYSGRYDDSEDAQGRREPAGHGDVADAGQGTRSAAAAMIFPLTPAV